MEESIMLESEFNIGINNNVIEIIHDVDYNQNQSSLHNSYSELEFDQLVDLNAPNLNLSGQSILKRPIMIKTKASNQDIWKLTDYLQRKKARVGQYGFGEYDTPWHHLKDVLKACLDNKIVVALEDREELCGFDAWSITNDHRDPSKNCRKKNQFASLDIFHVLPRYRQQGIGTKMFLVLKDVLVTKEPRVT